MFANDLINIDPSALNPTIEFLTAMVTPTLLISATGSLVLFDFDTAGAGS